MLRKIRISLAAVIFTLITLLFLDFTGTLHAWFGWLAKIQFLPALLALNIGVIILLVALTLLFGRVYCSVICPMGFFQDVVAWISKKVCKKKKYTYSKALTWLRYTVLAVIIIAFIAGIGSMVALLDPYGAYGRIASNLFGPIYKWVNNFFAYLAERANSYAFYSVDVWMKSLPVLIIAVITLLVLAFLAWRGGRTYCNTICPVGTVLSFFSRFSFLKIKFDEEKCRNCSLCTKNCKASCIDFKSHSVDYSRCVVCGDCIKSCKFGALHYRSYRSYKSHKTYSPPTAAVDTSKRSFLIASALVSTAAMAQEKDKIFDGGYTDLEDKVEPERQTPLTPPGSLSAQNMAQHCTGCQLCVSECPNDVLRPSTDLMHLMQPVMSYERGHCRPECTRCSEVCPAGAIKPIDREEKTSIQIGHAVWIKKNCVPITDGVECGNCARHCPAGVIEMVPLDEEDEETPYIPAVNEEACIGCGACEYVCPARPYSAIYVEGHEVHKKI